MEVALRDFAAKLEYIPSSVLWSAYRKNEHPVVQEKKLLLFFKYPSPGD